MTEAFLWHTIYLQIHKEISEVAPMGFLPLQYLALGDMKIPILIQHAQN